MLEHCMTKIQLVTSIILYTASVFGKLSQSGKCKSGRLTEMLEEKKRGEVGRGEKSTERRGEGIREEGRRGVRRRDNERRRLVIR